jgi:HD-like signal output (HDOD) protein
MSTGLDSRKIKLDFQKLVELPVASPLLQGLLNAINDEDVSIRQFSAIVRQDVALAARLVGLSNSAYFGQSTPITSVDEAIFKSLGLRLAKSIALSIAMVGTYGSLEKVGIDMEYYWLKSMLSASLARSLCTHLKEKPCPDNDVVYLSGLLHDFGLLPVAYLYGNNLEGVFDDEASDQPLYLSIENKLGFGYHEVGKWVARKWQLPDCTVAVIGHYHEREYSGDYAPLVHLLSGVVALVDDYLKQGETDLTHEAAEYLINTIGIEEVRLFGALEETQRKYDSLKQIAHELSKE